VADSIGGGEEDKSRPLEGWRRQRKNKGRRWETGTGTGMEAEMEMEMEMEMETHRAMEACEKRRELCPLSQQPAGGGILGGKFQSASAQTTTSSRNRRARLLLRRYLAQIIRYAVRDHGIRSPASWPSR